MNDLESSGLLSSDEPSTDQPAGGAAPVSAPAIATGAAAPAAAAHASSTAAAQPADAAPAAAHDAGGGADADASDAAADSDGGGQAEQRVLGPLAGRSEWTEVMDMGSRRVYFWNPDTDAVEWEPPSGGVPRDVGEEQPTDGTPEASSNAGAGVAGPQQQSRDSGAAAGTADTAAARPVHAAAAPGAAPTSEAADAGAPTEAAAAAVQLPSAELAQRTAGLVERLRAAAGGLFAAAPKLVWLAIEAEIRAKVQSHCSLFSATACNVSLHDDGAPEARRSMASVAVQAGQVKSC